MEWHILWNFQDNKWCKTRGHSEPSAILHMFYVLLVALKNKGIGCWIGSWFVAVLGYVDDLLLLAPSLRALRNMLSVRVSPRNIMLYFTVRSLNVSTSQCINMALTCYQFS